MKDPFQKRPLPAFLAALCFVLVVSAAATLFEESILVDSFSAKSDLAVTSLAHSNQDS